MALYPPAHKRLLPPGVNHSSGGMGTIHGAVVHVIVGSIQAADGVFHNPKWKASAHFGVAFDGAVTQWVDTADKAWAQGAGNPNWYSIETEGRPENPLTDAQLTAVGALVKWLAERAHFPLRIANSPADYGVGTHQMGGGAWGGHSCPGSLRSAQRGEIVRRAQGAPQAPTVPLPPQEQDMSFFVKGTTSPKVYLVSGLPDEVPELKWVGSESTLGALHFAGWGRTKLPTGFGKLVKVGPADVYEVADSFVTDLS